MAETLRELVVSLSLQSDNFSQNIKSVQSQIKEAESRFKAAGAGVDNFANRTAGLSAKAGMLGDKMRFQAQIVQQYERALTKANTTLVNSAQKNKTLATGLDAAKSKYALLKTKIEQTRVAYQKSVKTTGDNSEESNKLGLELMDLEAQYKATGDEVKKLEGQLTANSKTLKNNADSVTKVETALNEAKAAEAATKAELDKTNRAIKTHKAQWEAAAKSLDKFGASAVAIGKSLSKVGNTLTMYVTAPLLALGALSVKSATDFESAFAGVRKTVDMTETEFATFDETLKGMSTVKPASYVDLAGLAETAGQLGISNEYLATFVGTMADLNEATNLIGQEGATELAKFANIVSMNQGDFERLGSTLVALGNNFATTEADIMAMATRLAGAGSQVGLSEAQILAFSAALSSVGIEAEAGGSAFSKVMVNMQLAVETGKNGLKDFAKVSGMSSKEFQKAWKEDSAKAIQAFIVGLSKMDEKGISSIKTLDDMGISEVRLRDTLLRASNASGIFTSALEMSSTAWEENTALSDEAAKRYETHASKMAMMANRAKLTMADFGENIIVALNPAMEKMNEVLNWFNSFDEETQNKIINAFAIFAVTGPIVKAIGGTITAIGKIGGGLGSLAEHAPAIIAAMSGPVGWITLAAAGAVGLGIAIASLRSDMEVIADKASSIQLRVDETSKNETIQAIAEVRKEIEGLWDGGMTPKGAGTVSTVKAGYGTTEMYGQSLGYLSGDAGQKTLDAGTKYQAQIDQINADIVSAVEWGDTAYADQLAAQRDQIYAQWDAEILLIKGAYTQSLSELVTGMASQYPEAQKQIADAMEQYSALKALTEYDPTEMSEAEMIETAGKLLGMEGLQAALEKMGESPESIMNMYGGLPVNIADGLRQSLSDSLTTSMDSTKDSPIYTVLQSLLSDPASVEGLDFTMLDGSLADGIALLDFKAAAEQAQTKGGEIGQYLTTGLGTGIASNISATNKDVLALRDAVLAQTRAAFDMNSPSRVMAREGRQIPAGIAKGIGDGAYMVKAAMIKMAREAVQAAKRELVIASPSRIMRDQVGAMIPRGVVQGIEEETARQSAVVQNAFRTLVAPALAGAQSGLNDNRRSYSYRYGDLNFAGANFVIRDKQDIRALAYELHALETSDKQAKGSVY